jgi:magnesium chelatase family protein
VNLNHVPVLDRRLASILRTFTKELNLSPRVYARILIVARRIAEWAHADRIETPHLLEAIQFCTLGER